MLQWKNTEDCKTKQFWIEVKNDKDDASDEDFAELGLFALYLLALPSSNKAVKYNSWR
ncbi:hypothetical protein EYF80_050190 [Scomber scombrus]|uniref:Uncharacterized protein n=1 Tax=Scomber scombrus TaxID=13677 RepID=A0AAV1P7G5_SCOSC